MQAIAQIANNIFATAKVKNFKLIFNQPEAKTYIEVERDGIIYRHGLDITIGRFLEPHPDHVRLVVWRKMEKMVRQDEMGELHRINFNGTAYSIGEVA